jgi:hypothetical protein
LQSQCKRNRPTHSSPFLTPIKVAKGKIVF